MNNEQIEPTHKKNIRKHNSISINIPEGYYCFQNGLTFDFKKGMIHILTGENGSGKSQVLKWIFQNQHSIKSNKSKIIYKKTAQEEIQTERSYRRMPNEDLSSVDGIINTVLQDGRRKTRELRDLEEEELMQILFNNSNYFLKKHKPLFAHIFSEVLSDVSSGIYSYNEILKKFGFELKKDNNRDKNLLPEDYGDFEECPSKIPDSKKLVEFIKECLPDFEPNRFIFDLSKILELDYKINKASRETVNKPLKFLYKKINYELSQEYKGEKPFRWQLHEPSIHRSYTLSFESHNQSSKHVPFKHLSTGERIIFELLCYKYLITDKSAKDKEQQKPNLLILDEFDANLNPKLSQMYLKILYELTEYGVTIFLSTHSSDTVCSAIEHPKKDDKMRLYWLDLEKNTLDDTIDNVEILKKLSPSWESIHEKINQLEQQKSQSEQKNQALEKELQNLKPQKVFICEDEGGVQFWKSIFENFPGLNDVQVFSSKGCANNQHEIILNGIRSRDNTYNPKIFRQLDRDGLDNDLSKELENKLKKKYTEDASKFKFYQVKILPVCEIENFDLLSFYRKDACSKSKIDKSIKSLSKTIYSEIRNNLSGKIEGKIGKNKGKEEYEKLLRKNDDLVNNGDDVLNYIKYFPGKQIKKELKIKHNMPSDYKTINDYSKEFGDYFEKIKSFFEGASGAK